MLSPRCKGSNPIGWSRRENALTFHQPETLQLCWLWEVKFLSLSSIHTPSRVSCSSGTLSKLKYMHSSAKCLNSDVIWIELWLARLGLEPFSLQKKKNIHRYLTHQQIDLARQRARTGSTIQHHHTANLL